MPNGASVTAIIVTYAPDAKVLAACLGSLRAQDPRPIILIADNLAKSDPEHAVALSFQSDDCGVLPLNRNYGFGGAINMALRRIDTPFVLISNFDIVYDPGYLAAAVERLKSSGDDVVGIAGKTLFYPSEEGGDLPHNGLGAVIDNAGTLVNGLMLAYNRGVGQIDIGQYDVSDRPMGACFAAFLARRSAFEPMSEGGVGLLDPGYFMYYEDIDWCYRANILGFRIIYEPAAVAWHHHSLTTRGMPLFFKYHLIQRNLYRTIMKNMRFRTVIRLWALHARLHMRRARIERQFGPVTARILLETLAWAPVGLFRRIPIRLRRKVSDTDIVNLSIGEEGHLDDLTLKPRLDWRNPLASLERLVRLHPDHPAGKLVPVVRKLAEGSGDENLKAQAISLAGEACPELVPLLRKIKSSSRAAD